jgi:NADH:ubiquinone oxidoreductase subunit 4 (subunit M)
MDQIPISALSRFAMSVLIVAIIGLGVYPQPILRVFEPTRERVVAISTK